MCALDQDLKTLIQEAAEFVADLPESIQPLAFQLLVHGQTCPSSVPNVGKTDTVDVAPEPEPEPSPPMDEGAGWASILAREAGVAEDKIRSLLGRDEEGLYVIHADFGDREADRIRNIGVLVLWGARVLTKDIYAPQTLLYRAHTRLGQSTRNITTDSPRCQCRWAEDVPANRGLAYASCADHQDLRRVTHICQPIPFSRDTGWGTIAQD